MPKYHVKDPQAKKPYQMDWIDWLSPNDALYSSSWSVQPAGLTIETSPPPSNTTTNATVWLSGGTVDTSYTVTNHITTVQGLVDERSITVAVHNL